MYDMHMGVKIKYNSFESTSLFDIFWEIGRNLNTPSALRTGKHEKYRELLRDNRCAK